jgi:anti-sigma factor RsiW
MTNAITKENYEEYFLLYVDNELPASVRSLVERFVADNPDLKEEWEALLQCRFQPDQESGFPDKGVLLQYESELVSYIDGELDPSDREALEANIHRHPSLAAQLHQLQLTVSQPDPAIVFPDKERLYKPETRRVVPIFWLRSAAAAAVLIAIALLFLLRRQDHTSVQLASGTKKSAPVVTPASPHPLYSSNGVDQTRKAKTTAPAAATVTAPPPIARVQAEVKDRARRNPMTPSAERAPLIDSVSRHSDPLVAIIKADPDKSSASDPDKEIRPARELTPAVPLTALNIPKEESSFATQALMEEAQGDGSDNLAATQASPGKSKLRGILRRVTRAFGKTADRDGDGQKEVLISAFQIALK